VILSRTSPKETGMVMTSAMMLLPFAWEISR
jgi:hypothetical protein